VRTLYGKLALVLALLLVALGALYAGFTFWSTGVFLQEVNQRLNRNLARQLLVQQHMAGGRRLDQAQIKSLFSHYMKINPAIEIYLLDAKGNILAYEAPKGRVKRHRIDLGPIRRFLADDTRLPILGEDPRSLHRRKIFSAAAYPFDGPPRQYLYVILGGEAYDSVRHRFHDSYFVQLSTAAAVLGGLFGLVAGLFLFNLLTRRLRRLTAAMERFRASGFRDHTPYAAEAHGDEVERLGATFDAMAERIREQVQALEAKDALRRNLVANVSHDLRTPLAGIQGYLETLLLKEKTLDPAERRRYLQTAYDQGERLTHLVAELFELARLDAAETLPQAEPLALAELANDAVQQCRLAAERNGVTLIMGEPPPLPPVAADAAMLNRVLENLLHNALAHTPAGGRIEVRLNALREEVRLDVCNSGEDIDPQALEHLFERFYQSPEGRAGGGAGLGLAIVKRIVELHGGTVGAHSDGGETCFTVELPCSAGTGTPVIEK